MATVLDREKLHVEVARERVVVRWPANLHSRVNYASEDLLLQVLREGAPVRRDRVNHLEARELVLPPGDYQVELVRAAHPEIEVRTSALHSPVVLWIQESPSSHVVTWSGIDWEEVRREIEQIHGVSWEEDTAVWVQVTWADPERDPRIRHFAIPGGDHVRLEAPAERLEVQVRAKADQKVLKTLFAARRLDPGAIETLARAEVRVSPRVGTCELIREVIETDTLQARARWRLAPGTDEVRLELERNGEPFRDQEERVVPPEGNWFFGMLPPGTYRARLRAGGEVVAESPPLTLPEPHSRIVLMPIDEDRLYAYWHVDEAVWRRLAEEHGDLMGRVRCYLKVYHDWGGLHHHVQHDREVNLDTTREYYLQLPSDRVYRVQLVAVIDGWKVADLTPVSNPAQTGRHRAGSNPLSHLWVPESIEHPTIRPLSSARGVSQHSLGYLILHLHAHLPFIPDAVDFDAADPWRPGGYPQEWYAEAVRETYLPLLAVFERLVEEGVDFKLSIDLSPSLVAMMKSPRHQADTVEFLERMIALARQEVERTAREEPHYTAAAHMHLRHLRECRELFLGYGGDLAEAFRRFQELGKLEILTCAGTHAMLPLWLSEPQAVRGQIMAAMEYHQKVFGRPSVGMWLPECAYAPGVERFLEEAGVRYFFSETHTVTRGDAPAEFGVNAPVYAKGSRVALFPRDPETGRQVWSGEEGYPGDPDYLDFHIRGGPFKYNRITDRSGGPKQPYNPAWATEKAARHAQHFMECRNFRFQYLHRVMWKKPLVVAPYDAELFGHHWYEGPQFLYFLFKKLHYDQNETELITPAGYLAANPTAQEIYPAVSSWGDRGSFDKWMYGAVAWMYRHGHEAAREMGRMAAQGGDDGTGRRILAQAGRQLMLAMSSDLPFVISNGHFIDRMKELFFGSLEGFWELSAMYWRHREGGGLDEERLRQLELENCIFPDLNPYHFAWK